MPFKMSKTDKNICIHNGTANSGSLAVLCIFYRDFHIICTAKSVANNDLTAGGSCIKTIEIGTVHMLQSVLSASWIQSVTVCQERQASLLFT